MRFKAIALAVAIGAAVTLFVTLKKEGRAEAAQNDCYAAAQGPSSPTICQ